ncbi:MAG: hypothetical protein K2W96_11150 [Gemmataceae bacterium]|nr:hypothetical protein [Gemmataceae bacterium]
MQVCYVLTADGWNRYAMMAYLSASSLRRIHPACRVLLITDEATCQALEGKRGMLAGVFDDIVPCPARGKTATERSRFLKTSLRRLVSGDFLYLDTDILVARPLDPLWSMEAALALAPDANLDSTKSAPDRARPVFEQLGWPFPPRLYLNCGVMLARDRPEVARLFNEWHGRWLRQVEVTGSVLDQQPFSSALDHVGCRPAILSPDYNYMVHFRPRLPHDVRILHFFATSESYKEHLLFTVLLNQVAAGEPIQWELLDRCLRERHPWGVIHPWLLVRSGHLFKAVIMKLRQLFGFARRPEAGR